MFRLKIANLSLLIGLVMLVFQEKGTAQASQGWKVLSGVTFKSVFDKKLDDYFLKPRFSDSLKALDGKPFELQGYYIPFELEDGAVIISKYPYAQCFFCGNAGPESVAEIFFKQKGLKFLPDQLIRVKGTLKLNADDADHVNYILEEAEVLVRY